MRIETTFSSNYVFEVADELPSSGLGVRYFPEVDANKGRLYETALRFTYHGQTPWWGVFAARSRQEMGISMVSTTPDPDCACVVSHGTGYIIDVGDPQSWDPIELYPVLDAKAIVDKGILVLNDFTRFLAYAIEGLRWRTAAECSDDLKIIEVSASQIKYSGWDASSGEDMVGYLDILTGKPVVK